MNYVKCCDSYEEIKKLEDKSIDCIYTDIPYLFNKSQKANDKSSPLGKRISKLQNIDLKNLRDGIDYAILDEFVRVMKKINCFIWCSKLQISTILNYFINKNCNFEILMWGKTNPTPACNNIWLPDIEYCLYFREKGVRLNDGYPLKKKWFISPLNVKDKKLYNHPTIKPLDFVRQHVLHTTKEGDVILDPFVGSGTTLVAAKETNRNYIGFDIDPINCEICENRLHF